MYMISRGFKAFGGRYLVIITEGGVAKTSLKAAQLKNVAGAGYGVLLSHSASFFEVLQNDTEEILHNGILFVCEESMSEILTYEEYAV